MKLTRLFLFAAAVCCTQASFAQTGTQSTSNMQAASSTNTGTQTSSPTTTGMSDGNMVTPPAQTQRSLAEDQMAASRRSSGTMTKTQKTKTYNGKGKMKAKM
jgi:hypothetical protein